MRRFFILLYVFLVVSSVKANSVDDDFNVIKFTYEMFLLDDYNKIIENVRKHNFIEQKNSGTSYWADYNDNRKPFFCISRWKKKDTKLYKISISVNKWEDKEIIDCLNELGFKETSVENRTLGPSRVVDKMFTNESGTQCAAFETYYSVNIVKDVVFKWTSENVDKGEAYAQYTAKKQGLQSGQNSGSIISDYSNGSKSENNVAQNEEDSPTNNYLSSSSNTSNDQGNSAQEGEPVSRSSWIDPGRRKLLDIEYQRIPHYNSSFSALHHPNRYGAHPICLDDELKRNGIVTYYAEHPLGYLPCLIDDYTIPLYTSYNYGHNFHQGRKKETESCYNDNIKMSNRLADRLATEFEKQAFLKVKSCAAPHTGVKMIRNFELTGIDNLPSRGGMGNEYSYADITFCGKVDKIPDDFNSFSYGIILISDCQHIYCATNVKGYAEGIAQDSDIELEKYNRKNYNLSFRVRLDYKSAYVLCSLTNIMLVRTDSDIWKKALENHGMIVKAYDDALKVAKDKKYKEYKSGLKK